MDSPLAPKPVVPGLRSHRVPHARRDRKGKNQSFDDELAHEHDDAPQTPPAAPAEEPSRGAHKPPKRRPGHLLDVEV